MAYFFGLPWTRIVVGKIPCRFLTPIERVTIVSLPHPKSRCLQFECKVRDKQQLYLHGGSKKLATNKVGLLHNLLTPANETSEDVIEFECVIKHWSILSKLYKEGNRSVSLPA